MGARALGPGTRACSTATTAGRRCAVPDLAAARAAAAAGAQRCAALWRPAAAARARLPRGGRLVGTARRGATTSSRAAKGPAWSGSTASSRRCRSSKAPPRRRSFAGTCRACMPEHHDKARPQRWQGAPPPLSAVPDGLPGYAELHALSNFSFQRGASHPGELVVRAYNLGYAAVAITDECSVAGVVRADAALKRHLAHACQLEIEAPGSPRARPFQLLFGSEFDLAGARLVAIARDLPGWGGLCEFITAARAAAPKGTYRVSWESSDFGLLQGCEILYAPRRENGGTIDIEAIYQELVRAKCLFDHQFWLAVELLHGLDDALWLAALREVGARAGVPLVAAGDVHMHVRSRKRLQDVLTAIRLGRPVAECGRALESNAERHLRPRLRLAGIYPPELLAGTLEVARRC